MKNGIKYYSQRVANSVNPTVASALLVFRTSAAAEPADGQTYFFACWQEESHVEHKNGA